MKIKFRAYNTKTKNMLYSNEAPSGTDYERLALFFGGISLGYELQQAGEELIIMQFTGLTDRNGKDIYEGDIIVDDGKLRAVKWSNQNASFYLSHTNNKISFYKEFAECAQSQSDGDVMMDNIEVVGNIYENPELIQNESK